RLEESRARSRPRVDRAPDSPANGHGIPDGLNSVHEREAVREDLDPVETRAGDESLEVFALVAPEMARGGVQCAPLVLPRRDAEHEPTVGVDALPPFLN